MVALFRYVRDLDLGVALKVVDGNRVPKPMGADVGDVFCCTSRKIVVEKIGNLEWRKHHRSSSWKHLSFWGMTKLGVPTLALDSPSSVRAAQSWFAATWQLSGLEGPA